MKHARLNTIILNLCYGRKRAQIEFNQLHGVITHIKYSTLCCTFSRCKPFCPFRLVLGVNANGRLHLCEYAAIRTYIFLYVFYMLRCAYNILFIPLCASAPGTRSLFKLLQFSPPDTYIWKGKQQRRKIESSFCRADGHQTHMYMYVCISSFVMIQMCA